MYIHITTKCNMKCQHCCYSAGSNGQDMSFKMFREVLKRWSGILNANKKYIVLGGGEPTLNPEFWKFLEHAQACGYPWLATNGSDTEAALRLCEMAKTGELACALSIDDWHDPIDPKVVEAFKDDMEPSNHGRYKLWVPKKDCKKDRREIRTVLIPLKGGRANKIPESIEWCPCPGVQVKPDGVLYACGCDGAPTLGTIKKGITEPEYKFYDVFRGCYKKTNPIMGGES